MEDLDYIQKGTNKVNGQYNYVSHDKVSAKLHPLLVKHRVMALPTTDQLSQEGNRTAVLLAVDFVNVDCPMDKVTVKFPGYGVDSSDKGPGKAVSYAFKLACLKAFCLETGEDPDDDQKSIFQSPICQEFDLTLPHDLTEKDYEKLTAFLKYSAECLHKDVEDVKRDAVARMDDFIAAFKRWKPKKE